MPEIYCYTENNHLQKSINSKVEILLKCDWKNNLKTKIIIRVNFVSERSGFYTGISFLLWFITSSLLGVSLSHFHASVYRIQEQTLIPSLLLEGCFKVSCSEIHVIQRECGKYHRVSLAEGLLLVSYKFALLFRLIHQSGSQWSYLINKSVQKSNRIRPNTTIKG